MLESLRYWILLALLVGTGLIVSCRSTTKSSENSKTTEMAPVESQQGAIKVAEAYARKMNFPVGRDELPIVKRFTTPENDLLGPKSESEYKERIRRALRDKVYWMVYYPPKETQLGGEYAFFVDEKTGSVLA